MNKIRYFTNLPAEYGLTIGKVYTVVGTIESNLGSEYDKVILINDHSEEQIYLPFFFEDVTKEYRGEIIDEILM